MKFWVLRICFEVGVPLQQAASALQRKLSRHQLTHSLLLPHTVLLLLQT